MYQGRVRLNIRKQFLTKREEKLQQAAQGSGVITELEVFQTCVDVGLGNVVE